jgi:hypothetical protein
MLVKKNLFAVSALPCCFDDLSNRSPVGHDSSHLPYFNFTIPVVTILIQAIGYIIEMATMIMTGIKSKNISIV